MTQDTTEKENTTTKATITATAVKTTYEGSVIARAMERAGRNPYLKGHIQETIVMDLMNVKGFLRGEITRFTKSTTARCVDLVTTNKGGEVIGRTQVKDVVSKSGIDKLVRQAPKYRSANLVGSIETAKLFNAAAEKAGLSKRMASSGVSSDFTTRLAQQAGATGAGSLGGAILSATRSGGVAGAAVSAGVGVLKGAFDLYNGERDLEEVAVDVAKDTIKGGVTGAASCAAATATGAATAAALAGLGVEVGLLTTCATVALPVAAAVGVGYAVTKIWDWLFD